jgi:hypothetical protein
VQVSAAVPKLPSEVSHVARTRTEWLEAARKVAEALREQAALEREQSALARRRASSLHALSQARTREAEVCSEPSIEFVERYAALAEKEARTCEHEADTFEAEAARAEAEAEAAERRAAGSVVSFTESKFS